MEVVSIWKFAVLVVATTLAFVSETVVGFGATLFAVTIAGFVLPLPELLPIVVPVNVALSAYITARHLRHISLGYLLQSVVPPLLIGVPVGFSIFALRDASFLQVGFGLFVAAIAAFELRLGSARRDGDHDADRSLGTAGRLAILGVAGVVHGLFASGGPLVVYVVARDRLDKHRLRATLAALWLGTNIAMVIGYWIAGKISRSTVMAWPLLIPALIAGILAGEWIHARVDQHRFERAVFVLLGLAGLALALLGLRQM